MSANAVELGTDARVAIAGTMFGVVSGNLVIRGDESDNTDSESAQSGNRNNVVGLTQITASFTAQRQSDVTPHAGPIVLTPGRGNYVRCQVWPFGTANDFYDFSLSPNSFTYDHSVEGSRPQTIKVEGKSNDIFSLPAGI